MSSVTETTISALGKQGEFPAGFDAFAFALSENLETGGATTVASLDSRFVAVAFSGDGRRQKAVSRTNALHTWDPETKEPLQTILLSITMLVLAGPGFEKHIPVALMGDSRRIITGTSKGIEVWDPAGRTSVGLVGQSSMGGLVSAVGVSANEQWAISGGTDGHLKVWDLKHGAHVKTLNAHDRGINAVAIAPDGKRAISAASAAMKVWDLATGKTIATFTADAEVLACTLGRDGTAIVAGDKSGTVHFLELVSTNPVLIEQRNMHSREQLSDRA